MKKTYWNQERIFRLAYGGILGMATVSVLAVVASFLPNADPDLINFRMENCLGAVSYVAIFLFGWKNKLVAGMLLAFLVLALETITVYRDLKPELANALIIINLMLFMPSFVAIVMSRKRLFPSSRPHQGHESDRDTRTRGYK